MPDLAAVLEHQGNARRHAQFRAAQRLGICIDDDTIRDHEAIVKCGLSRPLGAGWSGRELHELDGPFFAVYCPRIRAIVTYLEHPSQWKGSLYGRGM